MKVVSLLLLSALPIVAQNDYGSAVLKRLNSRLVPMATLDRTGGEAHAEIMQAYSTELMHLFGRSVVGKSFARQLTSALWSKKLNNENLLPLNRAILNSLVVALDCQKRRCQLGQSQQLRVTTRDVFLSLRMIGVSATESLMITEQLLVDCDRLAKRFPLLYKPLDPS